MRENSGNTTEVLPVGGEEAVLLLSELESMASRQQREIVQQRRILEQREAQLAVLRGAQEPSQQDRLARLRHRLDQQQTKLNRLRLIRSQTDQSRVNNATLTSDLDCIRALFNEKEKELSLAVAKVEELTRQLEELRGRHSLNGNNIGVHLPTSASTELEKLRRELLYRNKMNEQQNQVVSQQRLALAQKQAEMASIDARIAQLQGRLQRKRALNQRLSQQLGSINLSTSNQTYLDSKVDFSNGGKSRPIGNIAAIEPYSHIPNDDFTLNKNDPKYQTLPYNTKFTVNFKNSEDDCNINKIQHSASASQIGQRSTFYQSGHQIVHSQSQSHIQGKLLPLGTNQQNFPYSANNTNNKNNNNISNNNNDNFIIENQASQGLRIHGIQQTQQHVNLQQKYHNCMNLSNSSALLNTQINCTKQNLRNIQLHQKPISSVAPSFPVKSPIYKTSSTKIHPVMPQTLNVLSKGNTGYNTLNNQNLSNQTNENVQNITQELNCVIKSNPLSVLAATISGFEQSNEKPLSKLEVQVRFEQNGVKYENNQPQNKYDQQINSPVHQTKAFVNNGKHELTGGKEDILYNKHEQSIKSETLKPDLNAIFDLKFDQNLLKNDSISKHDASVELQVKLDPIKYDKTQNTCDNSAFYDHNVNADVNTKFELPGKLSEIVSEQEKFKPEVERKIFLYNEMKNENKTKPILPPKPTKSNPPLRLISHEKLEFVTDVDEYAVNNDREEKKEEIPPMPTSEPPESPTDGQCGNKQAITSRPLTLRKVPFLETPKLRYSKSNIHVSINRRIEMPPAFLFPETEIPADLIQTDVNQYQPQETVESADSNIKKILPNILTNKELNQKEKVEPVDIVDAINVINIEEKSKVKNEKDRMCEMELECKSTEVTKRKKGNLKITIGKANLSRRVSFDPLALLLDASLEGELELVKKTAKEVSNPSSANDEGITALHNAICAGHLEIVKFLVEFGCDVNAQDSDGWTPLHCAASCNNLAMVKFLVEHGACIFATTLSDHETAAEKCEEDEEGFDGCSEYLYSVQEKLGIINSGQVYAVFDYVAQHNDELSLKNSDSLVIIRKGDDNEREWWWSKLGHKEGYVPRNLLGLYPRVKAAKVD
ncbi:apoptosis-stimulating of p53 protein 2 [Leptopilina boulardi]|uniref:apoptosis-stimulating of p53 protein 2 n=1 Tax=Leptopilina boulardi TaxID=63433 RepID=UPI0021F54B85|nr:apoptosis-stimulating of p53 protein 2 [Leptopilina boulardi]